MEYDDIGNSADVRLGGSGRQSAAVAPRSPSVTDIREKLSVSIDRIRSAGFRVRDIGDNLLGSRPETEGRLGSPDDGSIMDMIHGLTAEIDTLERHINRL